MKKFIYLLVPTLFGLSALANDSIYGGYNPASRCANPAGLENPIGVKKSVCRDYLAGVGIYACILPSQVVVAEEQGKVSQKVPAKRSCLVPRARVVVVAGDKLPPQEEKVPVPVPAPKPAPAPAPAPAPTPQEPGQLPELPPATEPSIAGQGQEGQHGELPLMCQTLPLLTEDMDASLIDPLINHPRSNNHYLRNLTLGEYRAACEDLEAKGAL